MIELRVGDIFDTDALFIVNPVNIVGVMGKGLAKQFKDRHPEIMLQYRVKCIENNKNIKDRDANKIFNNSTITPLKIGQPYIQPINDPNVMYRYIVIFPTKNHWKDPSQLEYIKNGLKYIVEKHSEWRITSISFPLLGSGLGGLDKEVVLKTMLKELSPIKDRVNISIYVDEDLKNKEKKFLKSYR
jgi:O-acetyl-ADP-ribose deacetylase (regulator of RNase III)